MWIFRFLLTLLITLLFFYYVTVCIHVITPVFKKSTKLKFLWIPFYGWIKEF